LASLCWAKHIVKKGEACGIIMGELNQSWVWLWHQGISLLKQDGTWWPRQWVYQVQYQMVFTLTFYEDYWLVQRSFLQDFKLSIDKSHVVISIVLDLQIEVCKSKNKWYQSKDKLIEWHLKWFSLYGARLDSIVARISDEDIKTAKTKN
jgi:hypothetical protein